MLRQTSQYPGNARLPTDRFTILEPQNPKTDNFYAVRKHRWTDFGAVWLTYVDLNPFPVLWEVSGHLRVEVRLVGALPHVPDGVEIGLDLADAVDPTGEDGSSQEQDESLQE